MLIPKKVSLRSSIWLLVLVTLGMLSAIFLYPLAGSLLPLDVRVRFYRSLTDEYRYQHALTVLDDKSPGVNFEHFELVDMLYATPDLPSTRRITSSPAFIPYSGQELADIQSNSDDGQNYENLSILAARVVVRSGDFDAVSRIAKYYKGDSSSQSRICSITETDNAEFYNRLVSMGDC